MGYIIGIIIGIIRLDVQWNNYYYIYIYTYIYIYIWFHWDNSIGFLIGIIPLDFCLGSSISDRKLDSVQFCIIKKCIRHVRMIGISYITNPSIGWWYLFGGYTNDHPYFFVGSKKCSCMIVIMIIGILHWIIGILGWYMDYIWMIYGWYIDEISIRFDWSIYLSIYLYLSV